MWYVEWEYLQEEFNGDSEKITKYLNTLIDEVEFLQIHDSIEISTDETDDFAICVYGGLQEEFLI